MKESKQKKKRKQKEQGKKTKGEPSRGKRQGDNESSCKVKRQNKGKKATNIKNTRKQCQMARQNAKSESR